MQKLPLGLLLVSVALIVIFIQQNLSPVLPLTFLGMKTGAFPLSLWILLALAAGFFTAQLVVILLQFPLASQRSQASDRPREARANHSVDDRHQGARNEFSYSNQEKTPTYADSFHTESKAAPDLRTVPDWVDDDEVEQNWVDDAEPNWVDEPIEPANKSSSIPKVKPLRTDYEVPKSPTSEYRSGSIYSYSYRKPENTGVGITESVNDAEYRVIIPPNNDEHEEQSGKSASGDYSAHDYVAGEYANDEYSRNKYSQDEYADDASAAAEISVSAPTPQPTPTNNQTKIQTNNNDEDDWSKPSKKNNDDWV